MKLAKGELMMAIILADIKVGDHLVSKRFGYTHHGIYIGHNKVIHYAGFCEGLKAGKVEITNFETFSQNQKTYVKSHSNAKYSVKQIIKRAEPRLGEDEYHLISNNCEHFVYWCIYGEHKSPQINTAKTMALTLAACISPQLAISTVFAINIQYRLAEING